MLENLEKLSRLPGVSGRETAVRDYIISQIRELADEITTDGTGSVIALKRGAREAEHRLMISAYMDEVGLIVTHICDDGLIKFAAVGRIDPRVICGRTVLVGEAHIPGVIGVAPLHLSSAEERGKCPDIDSMYIDIGADSAEEVQRAVTPGDVCLFETAFEPMGSGRIKGKALDGRGGCAVLIELMKQEYLSDVWFVFASTEKVGHRGAACAAYTVAPEYAIAVNGVQALDIPAVGEDSLVCRLGGGAVISFMDRRTVYDRGLFETAQELAGEKEIKVQIKQTVTESGEAGLIQSSRGGVRTLAVGIPCRYANAPVSMIAEADLREVYRLVYELTVSLCM